MLHSLTRDGSSPNGKPWIYFCATPADSVGLVKELAKDIFAVSNCAIWYDDGIDTDPQAISHLISQAAVAVMPVTEALLDPDGQLQQEILPQLRANQVAFLPVLDNPSLMEPYNYQFPGVQLLDRKNQESTAIPYSDKLRRYLEDLLGAEKLTDKLRDAFRGRLFLSYRKKDRALALKLMRSIHRNEKCQDLSFWYDEFLTPGEDFNQNISDAISKSDLFLLALTQNMVGEPNYVINEEYPQAQQAEKEILPVQLEDIDTETAQSCFPQLPKSRSPEAAADYLGDRLPPAAQEDTPERLFLRGQAYLNGQEVERSPNTAIALFQRSAEQGYAQAALRLSTIHIAEHSHEESLAWRKKWLTLYRDLTEDDLRSQVDALDRLATLLCETREYKQAFAHYRKAIELLEQAQLLEELAQLSTNYGMALKEVGLYQDGFAQLIQAVNTYAQLAKQDPEYLKNHQESYALCCYNATLAALAAEELNAAAQLGAMTITYFRKLVEIAPEKHTLHLANAYSTMGQLNRKLWLQFNSQACFQKAEQCQYTAIELLDPRIDSDPETYEPDYALCFNALGVLYLQAGELERAKAALDHAIAYFQVYTQRYPWRYTTYLAGALGNRGSLLERKGALRQALNDYEQAQQLLTALPGSQWEHGTVLWNIAVIHTRLQNFDTAESYYQQALAVYDRGKNQGMDTSPDAALCRRNYAYCLYQSGNHAAAREQIHRAREIYNRLGGFSEELAELADLEAHLQ